uniref:Uncharacterized protein n=1 Tax=Ditylenchus dipsaci TaxID=166011 RepID=A0A915DVD6_9BILA
MFERCFPRRIFQDQLRAGKQSSKDTSMRVQSTIKHSTVLSSLRISGLMGTLQTPPLNSSSSLLSSGNNRKRKAKKALRTLCPDSSSSPLSSGRKKMNRKSNNIKSKSGRKRRNDEADGAEFRQPDAKKRRDSNNSDQLRRSEIGLTQSSSLPMMVDAGVPAKQSKNQNVLPAIYGIRIKQV